MSRTNQPRRIVLPANESEALIGAGGLGWLTAKRGLTRVRARALLARRWKDVDRRLVGLRDRLLSSEPLAVVKNSGDVMLELVRKPPVELDRGYEVIYIIGEQATAARVRKSLARRGIAEDPLLVSFFSAFDGLKDSPAQEAGYFVPHNSWENIDQSLAVWGEAWKDHHVIYLARNGDQLLYSKTGRIGWYVSSESRYQPYWRTFSAFLRFYTRFQDFFYPLDSYSTRDLLNR